MLILAGASAITVLITAGFVYRRRGSWVILFLTFIAIPVAFFISLWATGIGHPSGQLHLAKVFLPYMVLPFTLRFVTEDDSAGLVCLWLPLVQVLSYGLVLASGWSRGRFWPRASWLLGVHILASTVAFMFHRGGYLDGH